LAGMVWRRVIRGLAVALVTVCAVAWVGSYWRAVGIAYVPKAAQYFGVIWDGRFDLARVATPGAPYRGWVFVSDRPRWHDWDAGATRHWIGFSVQVNAMRTEGTIPLWFVTLLSAGLLWLVWRWTRPKHNERGFPVEPDGKGIGGRGREEG
jgi:hypothetical protein